MNQTTKSKFRWFCGSEITLSLVLAAAPALVGGCSSDDASPAAQGSGGGLTSADAGSEAADETSEVVTNSLAFHMVDFVGWNNRDWGVIRHYHTADVKVLWVGQLMEGIDPHITAMQQFIAAFPDTRVLQHAPIIAQGEWTCMVGIGQSGNILTAARWRDGAIAEEYIFLAELAATDPRPGVGNTHLVSIENSDDSVNALTGAEPGWSCTVDGDPGPNLVAVIAHRAQGAVDEQHVFVPLPPSNGDADTSQ